MKNEDSDLIAALRNSFRYGLPNGWRLGWNRERFGPELKRLVEPRLILNVTSFDYSRCNSYEVECSDDAGQPLVLTIRISFILDLFVAHWTRYARDRRSGQVVQAVPSGCSALEESISKFLCAKGFRRIPDHLYDQHVPNVELELSEPSGVTVGKCLFDDYDG